MFKNQESHGSTSSLKLLLSRKLVASSIDSNSLEKLISTVENGTFEDERVNKSSELTWSFGIGDHDLIILFMCLKKKIEPGDV